MLRKTLLYYTENEHTVASNERVTSPLFVLRASPAKIVIKCLASVEGVSASGEKLAFFWHWH